jgi:hypothetical protein
MTNQSIPLAAALVEARKNSPDWQEAHGVSFGMRMGQMTLNTEGIPSRLAAMKPQHREALKALLRRWVELDQDATALVDAIDTELEEAAIA